MRFRKAIVLCALMLPLVRARAQDPDDLKWLEANTVRTVETYPFEMDRLYWFDEEGIHFVWNGGRILPWKDVNGLRFSVGGKVIVYGTGLHGQPVWHHITPASRAELMELRRVLGRVAESAGASVKYYTYALMTDDERYKDGFRIRERADSLADAKQYEAARELYQQLSNPYASVYRVHREHALAQLEHVRQMQNIEAAADVNRAIGMGFGLNFSDSHLRSDGGLTGISLARGLGAAGMMGFIDAKIPGRMITDMFADDSTASSEEVGETTTILLAVGSTLPYLRIGPLAAHAGYAWQQTDVRSLNLGFVGINLSDPDEDAMVRVDATFVSGRPRYGFAVTVNFAK